MVQDRQPAGHPGLPGGVARLPLRLLRHLLQRVHHHELRARNHEHPRALPLAEALLGAPRSANPLAGTDSKFELKFGLVNYLIMSIMNHCRGLTTYDVRQILEIVYIAFSH